MVILMVILMGRYGSIIPRLDAKNWPFNREYLPNPAYMVGGAVRDAILGRSQSYLDLDFIIPSDAVQVARAIATRYRAGFVLLDAERKIARVVFPHATADFAQQEGDSLLADLSRRDFTINAIAYNPHTQEIIDPLQGYSDIEAGLMRMISPVNLRDDPLRLIRAYRQAAQLGFSIESVTQTTIRHLATHINHVARERIRVEVGYLLANSSGTNWLMRAWQDGIFTYLFTNANSESFRKIEALDKAFSLIAQNWQILGTQLQKCVRTTIKTTWLGIAKLACLVHPSTEVAEIELQKLSYSRVEIRAVTTTLKLFPKLQHGDISIREQYFLFQEAGFAFPAIVAMALADDILSVTQVTNNQELNLNIYQTCIEIYRPLVNRFLNPDDLVAHPLPLVSGQDLILELNIPASPLIGKLLNEIAVAQAEAKIVTVEEAIEFARYLIE